MSPAIFGDGTYRSQYLTDSHLCLAICGFTRGTAQEASRLSQAIIYISVIIMSKKVANPNG